MKESTKKISLLQYLKNNMSNYYVSLTFANEEITLEVEPMKISEFLLTLRDNEYTAFDQLIDLCGVDYLHYGLSDGETQSSIEEGFIRGSSEHAKFLQQHHNKRFAVVYHLLSTKLNYRLRIKVYVEDQEALPSVHSIWPVANWFEREAYDLFGLLFIDHPDLRRILTDYGFIGYPFRKDFPLSGHVEMRYDELQKKVIYEPVNIEPRTLVPKVIRDDNRYIDVNQGNQDA